MSKDSKGNEKVPKTTPEVATSFDGLGIAPRILEILDKLKFVSPTPIQQKAIPVAIAGQDVMGIAQTGTGKTLAFGIPLLQKVAASNSKALILAPTRELALQINDSLKKVAKPLNIRTSVVIGGVHPRAQQRELAAKPDVVIGTPGRIMDMILRKVYNPSMTDIVVLDEADRMMDMGFAPQIKKILNAVPDQRQTMLFSATMPAEIIALATSYMKLPIRVEVAPAGSTVAKITQELFFVKHHDKIKLLESLLTEHKGSVLIFIRTKFGAKKLAESIRGFGHTATEIHSNRSLNQRVQALDGFKVGKFRVLVATDIAARGIDVTHIEVVINYDIPEAPDDYVHRIGRTGRAGKAGHAITLATPDQRRDVQDIERLIRKPLPISPLTGDLAGTVTSTHSYIKGGRMVQATRDRSFPGGNRGSFRGKQTRGRSSSNKNRPNTRPPR